MGSKEGVDHQVFSPADRRSTDPDPFTSFSSTSYSSSATQLPVSIPPLQDLSTDDRNEESEISESSFGTLVYVEDEVEIDNLSPPKLKRIW